MREEEDAMHTEEMTLSFTLEKESTWAVLAGEAGEEILRSVYKRTEKEISPESLQKGVQEAFKGLTEALGEPLKKVRALVIHDRMKGFMPFDRAFGLLGPYRGGSEENAEAAAYLSDLFDTDLSPDAAIVHLFKAMRMGEGTLDFLNHICTPQTWLARKLTGEFAADRADAGDMFPLLPDGSDYDPYMQTCFNALAEADGYPWRVQHLLPEIREAGEPLGTLTPEGAFFIDPGCRLKPGIPVLG
jgi:sugar (pentulose or hexulose) kinase